MLPTTGKGICRLSVMAVRGEASDRSEMVTQLLYGDHYEILGENNEQTWLNIKIHYDDYEGWIDQKQHVAITEGFYDQLNDTDYQISTDLVGKLKYNGKTVNLLIGSILPFSGQELFEFQSNLNFEGLAKSQREKTSFECAEKIAYKYLNAPYLWGGKSPFGIDCSGFTQIVFKICGYSLKRDSDLQAEQGEKVASLHEALPGDLAFFAKEDKKIYHVGIILDQGSIIHASGLVRLDKLDKQGIFNETLNCYTHKLFSIKRIFKR